MPYELFGGSVRGASHVRKGTPCEDFGRQKDCGKNKIFVVADGHGDPNCLRSNIGSEYICRIASEDLEVFANTIAEEGLEEKLLKEDSVEPLIKRLIWSIIVKWRNAVSQELERNPLTDEELRKAAVFAEEYVNGERIERIYGSTMIAGLLTERYLLLLQQGDGRCVTFNADGSTSQPIPWDESCVANITTSLCDEDAIERCRYHIVNLQDNPVIACIAGTDGVEDSFPTSMEKMHSYYRKLLRYSCENGADALENYLEEDLMKLSEEGSQDDVTISGIVDIERVKGFLATFDEQDRLIDLQDEVATLFNKVQSIQDGGKYQHLAQKYADVSAEVERAKKHYDILVASCKVLSEKIEAHEQEIPDDLSVPEKVLKYIKKLRFCKDELTSVKQKYADTCRERDAAYDELQIALKKKTVTENEYFPYRERYNELVQLRDTKMQELEKIKKHN